jgi:aminoglycoside phosphotransferase (APT) family kinase protein
MEPAHAGPASATTYAEPQPGAVEEPLLGGDVTEGVVRSGDTVRRPLNDQSSAVHAYLRHLECVGFTAAPRFLGIDARGREVLSFIEGQIAGRPLHPWATDEALLAAIARLQRRLHDCSTDVRLPPGAAWRPPLELPGAPALGEADEVIGHNDLTPENLVFRDREPVGIIDFDLAGPTSRRLDVLMTLLWWAPLRDPADRDPILRGADAGRRMRVFLDTYEFDGSRAGLIELADRRFARSWHSMRHRAEHAGGGWARMWAEGVGDVILRSRDWLNRHRTELERALTD